MRAAPAERQQAEAVLKGEGWTVVKIPKNLMRADLNNPTTMMKWCEDHIGPGRVEPGSNYWLDGNDVWYMYTWYGHWSFHFKHEKDTTAFSLRWG